MHSVGRQWASHGRTAAQNGVTGWVEIRISIMLRILQFMRCAMIYRRRL